MDSEANRATVRTILRIEWDPIGVSDIPEALDEYDAYADTIIGMLAKKTVSVDVIAQYLFQIATDHMGLSTPGLKESCYKTAISIVALQPGH